MSDEISKESISTAMRELVNALDGSENGQDQLSAAQFRFRAGRIVADLERLVRPLQVRDKTSTPARPISVSAAEQMGLDVSDVEYVCDLILEADESVHRDDRRDAHRLLMHALGVATF